MYALNIFLTVQIIPQNIKCFSTNTLTLDFCTVLYIV